MDWSKYPLDKIAYFMAALIPGFAALLTIQLAHPNSLSWFFAIGFLGYRTKLAVIATVAFVIGYSLSTFLGALLGGLGGAIGSSLPYKEPASLVAGPWRDPRWRSALSCHLGSQTPENLSLMRQDVYDWRLQVIGQMPEAERQGPIAALNIERIKGKMNDAIWSQWYDQFHGIVLAGQRAEWMTRVQHGVDFNLKTTALYLLMNSIWVPALRHSWYIVPCVFWTVFLVLGEWASLNQCTNGWSTLLAQIKYLLETKPVDQQRSLFSGSS